MQLGDSTWKCGGCQVSWLVSCEQQKGQNDDRQKPCVLSLKQQCATRVQKIGQSVWWTECVVDRVCGGQSVWDNDYMRQNLISVCFITWLLKESISNLKKKNNININIFDNIPKLHEMIVHL